MELPRPSITRQAASACGGEYLAQRLSRWAVASWQESEEDLAASPATTHGGAWALGRWRVEATAGGVPAGIRVADSAASLVFRAVFSSTSSPPGEEAGRRRRP